MFFGTAAKAEADKVWNAGFTTGYNSFYIWLTLPKQTRHGMWTAGHKTYGKLISWPTNCFFNYNGKIGFSNGCVALMVSKDKAELKAFRQWRTRELEKRTARDRAVLNYSFKGD